MSTDLYTAGRPLMTAAELHEHQAAAYGRNYAESDDGYSDMTAEVTRGWHVLASWGADGWNLGNWPYVMIYTRDTAPGARELLQICEGDRTAYRFATEADRYAAIDYLFLYYSADQPWSPVTWEDRDKLDAGELTVDSRFRGPYRAGSTA